MQLHATLFVYDVVMRNGARRRGFLIPTIPVRGSAGWARTAAKKDKYIITKYFKKILKRIEIFKNILYNYFKK